MDVTELEHIGALVNSIGVPTLLAFAVWYFKKQREKFQEYHKADLVELRKEHRESISALKADHRAELDLQRKLFSEEKNNYFTELNRNLVDLVKEIKQSNEERARIGHDLEIVERYQAETRAGLEAVLRNQEIIKTTLHYNGDLLNSMLKCNLGDDYFAQPRPSITEPPKQDNRHENTREINNPNKYDFHDRREICSNH